ncbi:MAG: hypothetical protein FRX48_03903 [Lasallia pustulata]|uniref:DUF833-domain-containing protein n=1 Tax=Lasallia pustulata TaxID=136370 RepID=A0A5M8PTP5_9LECA|nr:MAG: hypothetical protein FRX48_03903 [Lasallia pustulata]
MCIVLISTTHPDYPLILIDNRDEFLTRPTAPASWWSPPNEHVLAGHDLLRNVHGTWLGITKHGRIAVLTNFREEGAIVQEARSRGSIVNAFLTQPGDSPKDTEKFVTGLVTGEGLKGVGGFSLVCGNLGQPLAVISNRTPSIEEVTWVAKQKGETVGLSNAAYGDRSWPKVVRGEELMVSAISQSVARKDTKAELIEEMMRLLTIDTLPKYQQGEGLESYVKHLRHSIFIPAIGGENMDQAPSDAIAAAKDDRHVSSIDNEKATRPAAGISGIYGTQKQTVVLVDHKDNVTFIERTLYDEEARPIPTEHRDRIFEFHIET